MSTKRSKEYWKSRSEQLLLDVLADGEKVHRKLKSAYSKAQRDIENEIKLLLFRFQTQTGLDSKAAYELLKGDEFRQWRMDIGEYLAQIEATGDEKLLLELNTLAMRSRINRLEALQGQIKAHMSVLANEETKQVGEHLSKAYENTFYQNMYSHYKHNTERFIRAAQKSAIRLDTEAIKKLMLEDWKGSNYSKRIWKRQYEIAQLISDAVARNITRGQSLDNNVKQMMDSIKKIGLDPKLRSDYEFNCKRLIMTETAYMKAKADIDTYKRVGIEEYKFLATLDNKTSDKCQSHDNKIYKVEDAQPGINFPPLHPQCRSTTIAIGKYTPKEGTRAARNEDGSVYYVDKNLDYKAWKEKYVNGAGNEKELTFYEKKALNDYVGFDSYLLNEALRNQTSLSKTQIEMIKNLDSALEKFSNYEGNLKRSLYFYTEDDIMEFIKDYKAGDEIYYNQYLSTTKGETYNPDGQVQITILDSKKGYDISSINKDEQEVLYKRGAKFKVVGVVESGDGYFIFLKEMD